MKIAMIGSRGIPVTYSGIETHIEELCPRLVKRGHRVVVYCRADKDFQGSIYRGVELKRVPALQTKHLETLSRTMLAVLAETTAQSDIVHFHALGPSVFAALPRILGKRTVVTVHGLDWQRAKWGRFAQSCLRAGEWTSAHCCDATICVSKVLRDYYQRKHGIRAWYVPNGVNIPRILPCCAIAALGLEPKKYILFLSRLVPEKGCHYLIQAFSELDTSMKLVIAGGPGHTEEYVVQLKDLAAGDDRIVFTGFVSGDTLKELYSNAYIYILPSEMEGLPISLLEAMSFGLCVVTSDIPENLEVVGDCGFLFKTRNVSDLRSILAKLMADQVLVNETGQKGLKRVRRDYNWDVVADETERVYRNILQAS